MSPKELEELSFRNLVEWHRDDLTKVMNGALATDIFTEHHHSYLKKYGVLHRIPNRKYTKPTLRARKFLMQSSTEEATGVD